MKVSKTTFPLEPRSALDFVNQVRTDLGFEAISELVPGNPGDAESDTIVKSIIYNAHPLAAVAFHDTVGVYSYETDETRVYQTPELVAEFMHEFDTRQIPELIA